VTRRPPPRRAREGRAAPREPGGTARGCCPSVASRLPRLERGEEGRDLLREEVGRELKRERVFFFRAVAPRCRRRLDRLHRAFVTRPLSLARTSGSRAVMRRLTSSTRGRSLPEAMVFWRWDRGFFLVLLHCFFFFFPSTSERNDFVLDPTKSHASIRTQGAGSLLSFPLPLRHYLSHHKRKRISDVSKKTRKKKETSRKC
jgi:hypothetical protein